MLFDLARTLLGQVLGDGRAWPGANLSLSVGGFEDGISGNRGIGNFLERGDEAKIVNAGSISNQTTDRTEGPPLKRQEPAGEFDIQRFFNKRERERAEDQDDHFRSDDEITAPLDKEVTPDVHGQISNLLKPNAADGCKNVEDFHQQSITAYFCQACQRSIPEYERDEHQDWHFAKDLQAQEESNEDTPSRTSHPKRPGNAKTDRSSIRGSNKKQPEKGQKRLAFS